MAVVGAFRKKLFAIPPRETRFDSRGFAGGTPETRARIEAIGEAFVAGYHRALEETQPNRLAHRLDTVEAELRGFAYEGAAMALALLDLLTPWQGARLARFLKGPGSNHAYMVHVGVGWALARLPRRVEPNLHRFDPLLRWLILDGYGFHQAYFHWPRYVAQRQVPGRLSSYGRRAFDQGLGRGLWFVKGAEATAVADTVEGFPGHRQADLWAGVGLAAAYAGGVEEHDLLLLKERARNYRMQLAQGAAFAAKARKRAGNPAPHTQLACRTLCGLDASAAAVVTDTTLEGLPPDGEQPAYEVWRQRICRHFADMDRAAQQQTTDSASFTLPPSHHPTLPKDSIHSQ